MSHYAARHQKKREKFLASDYNSLTDFEIKVLITESSKEDGLVENLTLASLFSAREPQAIVSHLYDLKISEKYACGVLLSPTKLPINNLYQDTLSLSFIKSTVRPFAILPLRVAENILAHNTTSAESIDSTESINSYLRRLNQEFSTRLTLNRIVTYLPFLISQFAISYAEFVWLSGKKIKVHGGASYLQIESHTLKSKLCELIQAQYKKAGISLHFPSVLEHKKNAAQKRVGSSFNVDSNDIGPHFIQIKSHIEYFKLAVPLDIEQLHNYYTYYTLLMLNICTGHRPAIAQYGKLDKFNMYQKSVIIEDKSNRGAVTSRIIPLNDLVIQQVEYYLVHLSLLKRWFSYDAPMVSKEIGKCLESEAPLFRFMKKGELKALPNAKIPEYVLHAAKIKTNWNRHWLRTQLAKSNQLKESAINAFFGHEDKLDECFSMFSTLSYSDLKDVSKFIKALLIEMHVTPLAGMQQ